jgi:hypothetical protein
MRVGAGIARLRPGHVALLAALLAGCTQAAPGHGSKAGSEQGSKAGSSATADASGHGTGVAERGGTIGAPGSACALPVTFDIAKDWKAKAVDAAAVSDKASGKASDSGTDDPGDDIGGDPGADLGDDVAGSLLHQGPVTAACEVDAKPAGAIGFLRVWTGAPVKDDARRVLEAFVAAEDGANHATYRDVTAGDFDAVEVAYRYTSEILDETKEERALAITTPHGPVVLHLGGADTDEHRAMLPAFELAKRTLRAR